MAFYTTWSRTRKRHTLLVVTAVAIYSLASATPPATAQNTAEMTVETLIGSAISDSPSNYDDVEEAIKRFQNRDVLAARNFLERSLEKHPKLPPVDLTMAKLYFLGGQTAAGRASLELTVRNSPADPETYLILADQLYAQGRLIESEALYDKAIRLTDSFTDNEKRKRNFVIRARAGRGAVSAIRQDWPAAIEDLRVWAETDPEAANVHHRLGRALFLNKNVDEGFKELVKAREIEASLPNPYVSAAIMYAEMGEQESARKMFDRAVRQEKDDINTLLSYSQWLLQVGDVENAEETLAVARRADPDSLQVLILSGVAAKMAKKRKPAEDYLLAALAQSPANRDVLNQLALVLVEQLEDSKRQRAIEFAKMNTQLYPDASETNITLAWVLYQSGQNQLADQALKKGLQLGSRAPDSSYLVAKMLADQSQNDNAKRLLDEALANKGGIFVYRADAEALRASLN